MPGSIEFNSVDLIALANYLKTVDAKLARSMKTRVRNAAKPLAAGVVASAEGYGLRRAAGAVRVRTSYTKRQTGVRITVLQKSAPYARPIDRGNQPGINRHPVFGDPAKTRGQWTWVNQPIRPFFDQGTAAGTPAAAAEIQKILLDVLEGLK